MAAAAPPRRARLVFEQGLPGVGQDYDSPVRRGYNLSTFLLSAALLALGPVMIVSTLVRGGGALALGLVLGTLFTALGAARVWLALRPQPDEQQ
jgi:hypothetical protein